MKDIPKAYNASEVEDSIFALWEKTGFFRAELDGQKESYTIVIPPPNVTGVLHMGHALNNTIQDILIRKARLDGKNVRWVLGTDHAGIATQNVVEKKLKKEGLTRHMLGREKFLNEVWKWKEEHGSTIINQLKKMGCSCDYSRERFTMDEGLARSVRECFVKLFKKGLVYQGQRMIHWCPRCLTALSDEEAEHHDTNGHLYTMHYQRVDGKGTIKVATTRPETLLGDTAVAVNPDDTRFKDLVGKKVRVPFVDRDIPVIADSFVDPKFGTGMVKVTPAHDPNDYDMGERHHLEIVCVMNEEGQMNENAGPYSGMDRFDCRKKILEDLKEKNLLEKTEDYPMAIRKCYRCTTVVEPRVSRQWFVKMRPLADKALDEYRKNTLEFYPKRFGNIYERWLEGIRDWCISRQIWWGHAIPVWYCGKCGEMTVTSESSLSHCGHCGSDHLTQEEDVLDTWFSSWLWPFSTLGWPDETKDMEGFYPTNVLVTAQEIIFFWVARMVMAGYEFTGKIPFHQVYIHGTVRDETRRKMSKSFGNVIDPLKIIKEYGADALRFSLMMVASTGNDVFLSDKKFEIGRNFANKIWNASRFMLMNIGEEKISASDYLKYASFYSPDDKLILRKLDELIIEVDKTIREFRFNDTALHLYDFFWKNFCDRYIESAKLYFQEPGENKSRSLAVLFHVLSRFLVCLQPVMPYISENLWQILRGFDPSLPPLAATALYPEIKQLAPMEEELLFTDQKYDLLTSARNLKKMFNIPPAAETAYFIQALGPKKQYLEKEHPLLLKMLKASKIDISENPPPSPMPSEVTPLATVSMELDKSLIDFDSERTKLSAKIENLSSFITTLSRKLSNPGFLSKASPEAVNNEKSKHTQAQEELQKLKTVFQFFK